MSRCSLPDVNVTSDKCFVRPRCQDARCLRSKFGKQFRIERECSCACPSKRCLFRVRGYNVDLLQFEFTYNACEYSFKDTNSIGSIYEASTPSPVTLFNVPGFEPLPISEILVSTSDEDPNAWRFRQEATESIFLFAPVDTNPAVLPTNYEGLNARLVSQFNQGGIWSVSGTAVFKNAFNNEVFVTITRLTIEQL